MQLATGNTGKCNSTPNLSDDSGFTLTEMLVVLVIIGLLAGLVGPRVIGYLSTTKTKTARVQMQNIKTALELYLIDNGEYPSSDAGLKALTTKPGVATNWSGPYLTSESGLMDPWKRPYLYKLPGDHGDFDLSSLGKDGREGGDGEDQDVLGWN
ncbi:MAG: type II secretion system major pseudopilin GspG [Hyphomicrobiales bacterium]|nr:type II secretion system major pseudopilin GspG [Hyphomicrobiales bacterium]